MEAFAAGTLLTGVAGVRATGVLVAEGETWSADGVVLLGFVGLEDALIEVRNGGGAAFAGVLGVSGTLFVAADTFFVGVAAPGRSPVAVAAEAAAAAALLLGVPVLTTDFLGPAPPTETDAIEALLVVEDVLGRTP